jgi:hypothetical protein
LRQASPSFYCWKGLDEWFLGGDLVIFRPKVREILKSLSNFCQWKLISKI